MLEGMADPPSTAPLSPAQIQLLRRQLLDKGAEINAKLTDLLSAQKAGYSDLTHGRPADKAIDRLRHFMALVEGRLAAVREGRYGVCETCGDAIPYEHLAQVPWIDTCQRCQSA